MTLKTASILLIIGLLPPASALAQTGADETTEPAAAQTENRVDYEIQAHLNGANKRLDGTETIRWTNNSGVEASELWFHLYLNAFSNNRTTLALEGSLSLGEGEWGWQRVKSVEVDGVDVTESFEYRQPDSPPTHDYQASGEPFLIEDDRTVFRVTLPQPVPSGQTAEIKLSWTSQLPKLRMRTGYKDDFLFVAQWFPKLGVFEGERGWNCHQFHRRTEFFSDYGTYRVTLNLPELYFDDKVGASGVRVHNLKQDGDRVEVIFEAPSEKDRTRADSFGKLPVVHDFVWTGDPKFVVEAYRFSFAEWSKKSPVHEAELARVEEALGQKVTLRDVDVSVLIHPEFRGRQSERHFEATANALYFYGLWFGEYPYQHITVVDPAWGGRRAGGMEYPTLFTAGTSFLARPDQLRPEGVIIHECGHQFWYGLVGNNEFEASWLDEGLNSACDGEVMVRAYGPRRGVTSYAGVPFTGVRAAELPDGGSLGKAIGAREWRWNISALENIWLLDTLADSAPKPLRSSGVVDWWRDQPFLTLVEEWDDPRWNDRAAYLRSPRVGGIDQPSWKYIDRQSYRTNSYARPGVAVRTLIGVVGYDSWLRGMRNFAEKWRYRHPAAQDFFDAFSEGAGMDLAWYFDDAFRSSKVIDWSVSVQQRSASDPAGWFQGEDGIFRKHEEIEKAKVEEADAAEIEVAEESDDEAPVEEPENPWLVDIVLRRSGELCLDLPVKVIFEDGTEQTIVWERAAQLDQPWYRLGLEQSQKVKSVVLDPDRLYYFDTNMSDNQWYAQGDEVAPLRWTERVLSQYGHLIHWYTGIGG